MKIQFVTSDGIYTTERFDSIEDVKKYLNPYVLPMTYIAGDECDDYEYKIFLPQASVKFRPKNPLKKDRDYGDYEELMNWLDDELADDKNSSDDSDETSPEWMTDSDDPLYNEMMYNIELFLKFSGGDPDNDSADRIPDQYKIVKSKWDDNNYQLNIVPQFFSPQEVEEKYGKEAAYRYFSDNVLDLQADKRWHKYLLRFQDEHPEQGIGIVEN